MSRPHPPKIALIVACFAAAFALIAEAVTAVTTHAPKDVISEVIIANPEQTPRTPLAFLRKLKEAGLNVKYHIVINGGAENISRGSFCINIIQSFKNSSYE